MVPIPQEFSYEFFVTGPTKETEVTFLMPNGMVILLLVNHFNTLAEIKEYLWDVAQDKELSGFLHDKSGYVFDFINSMAEHEEITDENRRLCDIKPTGAVLKLIECVKDKHDNSLNVQISNLIGKRLQEFDALSSAEINDFRFKMRKLGEEVANDRSRLGWKERLFYHFPLRIAPANLASLNMLSDSLQNQNIVITIRGSANNSFTFSVSFETTPLDLLQQYLTKRACLLNIKGEHVRNYVLKVFGKDEYLIGDYPLVQFQYIQDCLSRDIIPMLLVVPKDKVKFFADDDYEMLNQYEPKKNTFSTLTLRKKSKHKLAWSITDKYKITIGAIKRINCDIKRNVEIGIQVGLFHGGKSLCQPQKTTEKLVDDKFELEINETLDFHIQVCNIPRNAKVCFVIYEINKNSKSNRSKRMRESTLNKDVLLNPIAWCNTTVYDFRNQLKTDATSLYMWPNADDTMSLSDDIFHPLGTVVSNPDKNATSLTLTFGSYGGEQITVYPSPEIMISHCRERQITDGDIVEDKAVIANLQKLVSETDSLDEVHDQDRKKVWKLRYHWLKCAPDILPKLLNCVDWDNRDEVSEVVTLLRDWPNLPVEKSLELLDYAYADQEVRSFAVKCLTDLSDEDLLLYLLQLVQAIKHELFLDCDLVKFLLRRALNNQKIGHYLFWHLRSEMQVPSVSVRFGLILEAYCRGSRKHIPELSKQLECLDKLKKCSEIVRKRRDKEKAKTALRDFFNERGNSINNVRSPLDPSFNCFQILVDKCRVMDSKMKPLWIVFQNSDTNADDVYIIFKNGDDLRQDMLTLQMLRIMDKLWKREGLDLRMNPYNCISTEHRLGMIEVVLNAETIANIQKEKGTFSATSAFRKESLLAWLKDHNTTEAALKKAINEFTLSCAGYCVATYVLGVADRHSDNIMIKKTGQLFHIDFGHILGHFKEKFGFKRERVPFVLTHDFVHVISYSKGPKDIDFQIFRNYCVKAFLILRRHGGLILSLFAMMISTGLPELSSEKDLNYLKETLVLSKTEEEAMTHFESKFHEALCNSWKTSVNWATHNLAKNNKA